MDYSACDDYELVLEAIGGSEDAFEEIVNRYKNLVYSVISRQMSDRELANDCAQDVFLKVYKNLKRYSPEFKLSTWLMKITGNHVIDMNRKRRHAEVSYEEHGEEVEKAASFAASAESEYIGAEEARRIEKIFAGLPEAYRVPVVLFHSQGLSYQEIADSLGEPLSKVRNRIFRGRKILREKLAE